MMFVVVITYSLINEMKTKDGYYNNMIYIYIICNLDCNYNLYIFFEKKIILHQRINNLVNGTD